MRGLTVRESARVSNPAAYAVEQKTKAHYHSLAQCQVESIANDGIAINPSIYILYPVLYPADCILNMREFMRYGLARKEKCPLSGCSNVKEVKYKLTEEELR